MDGRDTVCQENSFLTARRGGRPVKRQTTELINAVGERHPCATWPFRQDDWFRMETCGYRAVQIEFTFHSSNNNNPAIDKGSRGSSKSLSRRSILIHLLTMVTKGRVFRSEEVSRASRVGFRSICVYTFAASQVWRFSFSLLVYFVVIMCVVMLVRGPK